uniref:EF-hand domain-containing protein n=1 Tax=Bursaphelenchus xylophilus TaxID=6326 RepID=A0A1I7SIZ8_BURXY
VIQTLYSTIPYQPVLENKVYNTLRVKIELAKQPIKDNSASLRSKRVVLSRNEQRILREQFQCHLQLVCQQVIACHDDPNFISAANKNTLMLHDLDRRFGQKQTGFFDQEQLNDAILACHQIKVVKMKNDEQKLKEELECKDLRLE